MEELKRTLNNLQFLICYKTKPRRNLVQCWLCSFPQAQVHHQADLFWKSEEGSNDEFEEHPWKIYPTVFRSVTGTNTKVHYTRLGINLEKKRLLYSHLYIYMFMQHHNDTIIKTHEDFFNNIFTSHFICKVWKGCLRFACERVLDTEHKLHILTPLLWPSRCVFLVLLMLGSTPSRLSEGPLGRVWLPLPHLVSSCLEVCWQLLWHPKLNWVK